MTGDDDAWREIVDELTEPDQLPWWWTVALLAVWALALVPGVLLVAALVSLWVHR